MLNLGNPPPSVPPPGGNPGSARPAVAARALSVRAGRTTLIQPIDLTLYEGEFVGLLGPSGCGKSTLLRSLAGQQKLAGGEVELGGRSLAKMSPLERQQIGFVPQDDVVHGSLKVERSLLYTGRLLGLEGPALQQRVDQVLKLLELEERRKLRTDRLSGGQRKRVSIAVELMAEPKVLFLDEPTAGLDPALEDSFTQACRGLALGGRCLLMSTHVLQSLDALDLVVILLRGYLVYLGPPQQAAGFFGVPSVHNIYRHLANLDPASAASQFAASGHFHTYVAARKVTT
jgi:ABC-type multidrug transport system ATPase subunit